MAGKSGGTYYVYYIMGHASQKHPSIWRMGQTKCGVQHGSHTYHARGFSLTRIWMGDRSYVSLAAGMSVVSYVWLCTCAMARQSRTVYRSRRCTATAVQTFGSVNMQQAPDSSSLLILALLHMHHHNFCPFSPSPSTWGTYGVDLAPATDCQTRCQSAI